jgi:hypothetical protein
MNSKKTQRAEWNKEDNAGYVRGIQQRYRNSGKKSNWNSGSEKLNKSTKKKKKKKPQFKVSPVDWIKEDRISELEDKVAVLEYVDEDRVGKKTKVAQTEQLRPLDTYVS